jgi:hypothetical protein
MHGNARAMLRVCSGCFLISLGVKMTAKAANTTRRTFVFPEIIRTETRHFSNRYLEPSFLSMMAQCPRAAFLVNAND